MYEFIKEQEIEKIVLEHVINSKKVEDRSKELLKHVFEQIVSRILLQIKLHIENNNQFKVVEKLYDETNKIKERYIKYLDNDYKKDIPTENEKDILNGVFKAIHNSLDNIPVYTENPIEYERMLIISTGLLKIKEATNKLQDDVVYSFELPASIQVDFSELLKNHMMLSYENVYIQLKLMVDNIVSELNDITNRQEINTYIHFLEVQEAVIKNFIYINLEIGQEWQESKEVNQLTAKYIYPLRQLYQDIHTLVSDAKYSIKKKIEPKSLVILNIDKMIESNILKDKRLKELIQIVEDDKNNTIDRIVIHINDELTKISTSELKRMKKASTVFELLSCVMLDLFEETLNSLDTILIEQVNNENHKRIIQGVFDTLKLKYSALKEKDETYHMQKKQDYLYYGKGLIDFKNEFEQNCETYLDEAINGSNSGFTKMQSKFIRLVEKEFESNKSKDLEYIKKDIIFEINTLEDLMHQSVDILRASEEKEVIKFLEHVDRLYSKIFNHLKRNDIYQIFPSAHDAFNGKIHEVLMVEEVEGFTKGEIIRTQNSGFIFGNMILTRASIIAAT